MGTSTDAILVFGFELNNEEGDTPEFLEEAEGDFEEFLNKLSGLPQYGEHGHSFDDQRAYRERCPADIILAVRGTAVRAWRGSSKTIESLHVAAEKITAFKAWCEETGIEYQEPKWLLVSMWG